VSAVTIIINQSSISSIKHHHHHHQSSSKIITIFIIIINHQSIINQSINQSSRSSSLFFLFLILLLSFRCVRLFFGSSWKSVSISSWNGLFFPSLCFLPQKRNNFLTNRTSLLRRSTSSPNSCTRPDSRFKIRFRQRNSFLCFFSKVVCFFCRLCLR
jgi:hypothetical protein